jgi:hypothetical protein
MSRRMSEQDWQALDAVEVYGHAEAHTIASEYTWGWTSCWFESTGEMNHYMFNPIDGRYALTIDKALYWWMDDDHEPMTPRQQRARERMLAYLTDRETRGDMGEVTDFRKGWVGEQ